MKNSFIKELTYFLAGYSFNESEATIRAIVLESPYDPIVMKGRRAETWTPVYTIYEDLWFTKGEIVRNRLAANLGINKTVFARKCRTIALDQDVTEKFMNENHLMGYTRSKFRYGLLYGDDLVAVAAFSRSRPITRSGLTVCSYEWVRYASKGSMRVVGGMGKLMECFVSKEKPDEIMSYADMDWSSGDAYCKLGFKKVGETLPLEFIVDKNTFVRIPKKKLMNDRKYRKEEPEISPEHNCVTLLNSGNLKFLRNFSFT